MDYKNLPFCKREQIEQYNNCMGAVEDIKEALCTLTGGGNYAVLELVNSLLRYNSEATRVQFCLMQDGYTEKEIELLANQYILQTLTHKN